jgi:hypothetical protein
MRSNEASTVPSSVLNVGTVPLEQIPALSAAADEMVQRILPGFFPIVLPSTAFSSSI